MPRLWTRDRRNPLNDESVSRLAARRLRGGVMPHTAPAAAPISTTVRLELEAPAGSFPEAVITDPRREHGWRVALAPSAESPTAHQMIAWHADILLPLEPTVLRYHFVLRDGTAIRERRQPEGEIDPRTGGVLGPLYGVWQDQDYQLAAYDPDGGPPAWVKGSVIYQIFPDRFARGDPENLTKGESTVYGREVIYNAWDDLPEHPPKSRDFYGGDLRGVIDKLNYLRDLGISMIYFTPLFASPTNHRYDASDYMKIDPRLGSEADLRELIEKARERGMRVLLDGVWNHCSSDSIYFKAARADRLSPCYRWFQFEEWPDKYEGWIGVKTMPEFVECPEVEEFFLGEEGVARRWLSCGIAGWRTDVTPWMTGEFWRRFRKVVRRDYPEAYLVSEDWGNSTHRLVGDSFDATMNYRLGYSVVGFLAGKLTVSELDDRLEMLRRDTPLPNFHAQMNVLDSHDTARILTLFGGSKEKVMLAAAIQLAYPGVPMIYYGTEAGLEGSYAEGGRRAYPWGKEDERLVTFYRRAVNARRAGKALSEGDVQTLWIDDVGGYAFLRRHGDNAVIALFNASEQPLQAVVPIPGVGAAGEWHDLLGTLPPTTLKSGVLIATLPPLSAAWLTNEDGG